MFASRLTRIRNTALFSAVFLLIIDRLAKQLALSLWHEHPQVLIKNLLSLSSSQNIFVAFSLQTFFDPLWLIIPIVAIVVVVLIKTLREHSADAPALILILAGAASNLFDRLVYGYVIDYIDLSYFTIFNIADILISVGVVWLLLRSFRISNNCST
jgi:signal peptidase II